MKVILAGKPQSPKLIERINEFEKNIKLDPDYVSKKIFEQKDDMYKSFSLPVMNYTVNGNDVWYYSLYEAEEEAAYRGLHMPSFNELREIITLYPELIEYNGIIETEPSNSYYGDITGRDPSLKYVDISCVYWSNTRKKYRMDKYPGNPFVVEIFANQPEFIAMGNYNPEMKLPVIFIDKNA